MRPLVALLVSLLAATTLAVLPGAPAQAADRAFSPRFTTNDTGDIDMFGNTVMTCPTATSGCSAARTAGPTSTANSALNNNSYGMQYVDVDADATTFNSSQSTVSLPSGATVLFAGLYWGGEVTAGTGGSAAPSAAARGTVRLRVPGSGSYQTITATTVDDGAIIYQGFADVTSLVAAAGNGTYTVANVQTGTGQDRLGGWTLVVAYRDTSQPARNLTVFDGLKSISSGASGTISVSGFQTPPAGPVNTTVGFVTYEGDLGLVGDSATLNGKTLSDAQHPASNFFDSRSSRDGVLRSGGNPSYANNLGFEYSMLTVDNTYVANGATSATIGLTSSGDVYAPGVVTFATQLYAPRIEQTKTVADLNGGLVEQGDVLRYTITGTNTGQDGAAGFVLRDPIPANTTYQPGTIKVTQPGGVSTSRTDATGDDVAEYDAAGMRVVARIGTGASATAGGVVAPAGTYTLVFDVLVGGPTPVVPDGTTLTNTATASFASQSLGTPFTAISTATTTTAGPDLRIAKTHTGSLVQGAQATYTLTVDNHGAARTQGTVTVTDLLPSGLGFVSAAGPGWTCGASGSTVTCTRSDSLAAGATWPPITLVVDVNDGAPATVANTATVAGGGDSTNADNSAVDAAPTVARTDLALAKSATPASVAVGQTVDFDLVVTNLGPSRSTGSTVVDMLPVGLTYVSADAGCSADATYTTITCPVGPLAKDASQTVHIRARAALGTAGSTLTNSATVYAHETDPSPGNDASAADVSVKPVDLAITSRIQGDPAALVTGSTYTWLLDVSNLGTSPAADSQVRFTVPAGVSIVPGLLDARCVLDGPSAVVCDLGTVGAGATVPQISIGATVTGAAPADISTTAVVSTTEPDAVPANNTATTSTPRQSSVDLAVGLAASPTSVGPGDTLTLTATVTNAGPSTPVDPTLSVVIPDGTTFVSAPAGCSYDSGTRTVTCTLPAGSLGPGGSVTRDILVTVGAAPADPLTATAQVTSATPDSDPSNNAATVHVPVVSQSSVSLTKTASVATAAPGDTVTYTLRASNGGPGPAQDVTIVDALPAGVVYASDDGGCTLSGSSLSCPIGTLAPGGSATVHVRVTVAPLATGPADSTHLLDATKVETSLDVAGSSAGSATATCPAGYLATDGTVRLVDVDAGTGSLADAVVLASHATADGRGWAGTVRNTAAGHLQAKVEVVCLSSTTTDGTSPAHPVLVGGPVTSSQTWTAGTWTVDLDCGPGRVAIAPGWTFASGTAQVLTSQRNGTGWRFVVEVPESAEALLEIRCLGTALGVAGGHTHSLVTDQVSGTLTVPAGQTAQTSLTCADDAKGIVAGWSHGSGVAALGSDAQPKTRLFRFSNGTASSQDVGLGLLCLSLHTGPELLVSSVTNTATVSTSTPDTTTADDTASASFTAAPAGARPFAAGSTATASESGRRLAVPITSDRDRVLRVRAYAVDGGAGIARRALVARDRLAVSQGRQTLRLPVTADAVRALAGDTVDEVRVVLRSRSGTRVVQVLTLR